MGRIRTIKPEFWLNEGLSSISEAACLLAVALLNYVDDDGYFNTNPGLVKAACFPLRELSVTIDDALIELQGIGFIEVQIGPAEKRYGRVTKFRQHQVITRPTPSKIKPIWDAGSEPQVFGNSTNHPSGLPEDSLNPQGGLIGDSMKMQGGLNEDSLPERNGMEEERKGKEGTKNDNYSLIGSADEGLPGTVTLEKPSGDPGEQKRRRTRSMQQEGTLAQRKEAAQANLAEETAQWGLLPDRSFRERPEPKVRKIPEVEDPAAFEQRRRDQIKALKAELQGG